jgi:hypothetical protein
MGRSCVCATGLTWQELFYTSAAIGGGIGLVLLYTLKASPVSIGEPEPQSNARNVYAKEGLFVHSAALGDRGRSRLPGPPLGKSDEAVSKGSLEAHLLPLLRNPMFYTLLLMSFILTLIREIFNAWLPSYLEQVLLIDAADAAYASAVPRAARAPLLTHKTQATTTNNSNTKIHTETHKDTKTHDTNPVRPTSHVAPRCTHPTPQTMSRMTG